MIPFPDKKYDIIYVINIGGLNTGKPIDKSVCDQIANI